MKAPPEGRCCIQTKRPPSLLSTHSQVSAASLFVINKGCIQSFPYTLEYIGLWIGYEGKKRSCFCVFVQPLTTTSRKRTMSGKQKRFGNAQLGGKLTGQFPRGTKTGLALGRPDILWVPGPNVCSLGFISTAALSRSKLEQPTQ